MSYLYRANIKCVFIFLDYVHCSLNLIVCNKSYFCLFMSSRSKTYLPPNNLIAEAERYKNLNHSDKLFNYDTLCTQGTERLQSLKSEIQKSWKNTSLEHKHKALVESQLLLNYFNKHTVTSDASLRRSLHGLSNHDIDTVSNCIKLYRKHLGLECVIVNSDENIICGRITKLDQKKSVTVTMNRHSKQIIFLESSDIKDEQSKCQG